MNQTCTPFPSSFSPCSRANSIEYGSRDDVVIFFPYRSRTFCRLNSTIHSRTTSFNFAKTNVLTRRSLPVPVSISSIRSHLCPSSSSLSNIPKPFKNSSSFVVVSMSCRRNGSKKSTNERSRRRTFSLGFAVLRADVKPSVFVAGEDSVALSNACVLAKGVPLVLQLTSSFFCVPAGALSIIFPTRASEIDENS